MDYIIQFSPFRIYQYINGQITSIVNHRDSLYFENSLNFQRNDLSSSTYSSGDIEYTFEELKNKLLKEEDCIAGLLKYLPEEKLS